jgi:ferredoxin
MVKYGIPMMSSSGYVALVDETLCDACGNCVDLCPFGARAIDTYSTLAWEKCMGCGVCTDQCPTGALSLIRDEQKGIPLDAKILLSQIDS